MPQSLALDKPVLVTGAAGFIGFHLADRLLEEGYTVVGLDNLNDYYDLRLKRARLERLMGRKGFRFTKLDLTDRQGVDDLIAHSRPGTVVNLAAQAGVRYSLENPHAYIDSNIVGFTNILEGCRHHDVQHLVYASSSSVYGANKTFPFSVRDNVDHPVSLYAATKKANELMAHTYSHLYSLPTTGLRFFTVYGPWGRPDMALFIFAEAMIRGQPIKLFNHGKMQRDFTYIGDIVEGVRRVMDQVPVPGSSANVDPSRENTNGAPYRLYNIGNNRPVELLELVRVMERALQVRATTEYWPIQPGDVPATFADIDDLIRDTGFRPETPIEQGVQQFVDWYRQEWLPNQRSAV